MKKQTTLLAAMIILGFAAFSQTSNQEKFHATNTTYVNKLIKLPDGSFTVLSTNRIFSVNASGAIVWSKEIPPAGGKSFEGASFVRTSDGSYVIAGVFDREPLPHNAITLVKTDPNGNVIWSRQYYDSRYSTAETILKTTDGGFVLTGAVKENPSNGYDDAYVMKLDANANIQWTSVIGTTGNWDHGNSITQTSDNGYAVTGHTQYATGTADMFVAKLNSTGSLLWSKFFGDGSYDDGTKIIVTRDGGLAVFGSHGILSEFGYFTDDYFLVKLQGSGAFQWAKYYGGSDNDYPGGFIQTTDGSYVMTGTSYSFNDDYNSDFYSIKTNATGNLLLSKATTGAGQIILTNGTGYIIGGYTQDNFPYDGVLVKTDANLNTCNSRNVTTVTNVSTRNVNANFHKQTRTFTITALKFASVNSAVSTSQVCNSALTSNIDELQEKKENNFKISVYPNPVKDKMILQFTSDQLSQARISISNIQGNLFFSKNVAVYNGTNKETINTNSLNRGSYFLSITLKNGNRKLIPFVKE